MINGRLLLSLKIFHVGVKASVIARRFELMPLLAWHLALKYYNVDDALDNRFRDFDGMPVNSARACAATTRAYDDVRDTPGTLSGDAAEFSMSHTISAPALSAAATCTQLDGTAYWPGCFRPPGLSY